MTHMPPLGAHAPPPNLSAPLGRFLFTQEGKPMTTTFTATNGLTFTFPEDGSIRWESGHPPRLVTAALREYFTAERDEQLGRWRDPKNPNLIVYPDGPDLVRVVNETTGVGWDVTRPLHLDDLGAPSWHGAALRYFAAHPKPNPEWYDAQSGELWILTIDGEQGGALAWRTVLGPTFETATGTLRHDDPDITGGRRLWPEDSPYHPVHPDERSDDR